MHFLFLISLLFVFPLFSRNPTSNQSFVTYEFSGGRFGDNLLAYLHGKWVSYKYDIPLLYKPFPYSDRLVLDSVETLYDPYAVKFSKKINFFEKNDEIYRKNKEGGFVYSVPYFPEFEYELNTSFDGMGNKWSHFPIGWNDEGFQVLIRKVVQPKHNLPLLAMPQNIATLAVHMRRGGGFDDPNITLIIPMKAPPLQFYIDGIAAIYNLIDRAPLYIYLFTDDREPGKLMEELKRHFPESNITFHCRESENYHSSNVLEDFFSMMQFDYLIRADSNYSYVASKLHPYKIVVSPEGVKWVDGQPIIHKLGITMGAVKYNIQKQ